MHIPISIVRIHKSPKHHKHIFLNTAFYFFPSVSTSSKVVKLTSDAEWNGGVYVFACLFVYTTIPIPHPVQYSASKAYTHPQHPLMYFYSIINAVKGSFT